MSGRGTAIALLSGEEDHEKEKGIALEGDEIARADAHVSAIDGGVHCEGVRSDVNAAEMVDSLWWERQC